ncbi:unnamed protein product, partial [Laminaria digitata]
MWGANPPKSKKNLSKTPLPADVRQLSRVIHTRLGEESAVCGKAWSAFTKATFERGRKGLFGLREEWLKDTMRAWSGQFLEISSGDRAALLRLNESLLDPDGFCPLRAKAGIRLKRRANPTGGGGGGGSCGGGGGPRHRRHRSAIERAVAVGAAPSGSSSDLRLPLPDGIARLKAISTLSAWSDAKANSAAAAAAAANVGGNACSSSALVVRAGSSVTTSNNDAAAGDDDDHPPLLDALERSTAGGVDGGGGGNGNRKDGDASTARPSGSPPLFTPKRQSTAMSLSWGSTSPWMPGSAQRSDQGWLSRLALAGSQTPPANSSAAAAAAGVGS